MKFIIFLPSNSSDTFYFYGDDDLDFGFATYKLAELFTEALDPGADPWPTFFQSCTILVEATVSGPAEVQLLFPELFI